MKLDDLLKNRRLLRQLPTGDEIRKLLDMAQRNFADAEVPGLSIDWRYMIAYSAVLALAAAVPRASGYRPRGEGHHATLFDALPLLLPRTELLASYFHECRKKRNTLTYSAPFRASEQEADELLAKAKNFFLEVRKWLSEKHPHLLNSP